LGGGKNVTNRLQSEATSAQGDNPTKSVEIVLGIAAVTADRTIGGTQQPYGLVVPNGPCRHSGSIGDIADGHLTSVVLLHEREAKR
jgi:hypothetical protein